MNESSREKLEELKLIGKSFTKREDEFCNEEYREWLYQCERYIYINYEFEDSIEIKRVGFMFNSLEGKGLHRYILSVLEDIDIIRA